MARVPLHVRFDKVGNVATQKCSPLGDINSFCGPLGGAAGPTVKTTGLEHRVHLRPRVKNFHQIHLGRDQINLTYRPSFFFILCSLTVSPLIGLPVALNPCLTKAVK